MSLVDILIFAAAALLIRPGWYKLDRRWLIFLLSILAVFWLQPATPIRYLDYWLPAFSFALTVLVWRIASPEERFSRTSGFALGAILVLLVIVPLSRMLWFDGVLVASRPPSILQVGVVMLAAAPLWLGAGIARKRPWILTVGVVLILTLFVLLKVPWLARQVSFALRVIMEQSLDQAAATDLRWLGFSYIAFRLLHVLLDARRGRVKTVNLRDFSNYVLFFPALTAGPIDRLERFDRDISLAGQAAEEIGRGGRRLMIGLFKKFVLADTLALFALNPFNAGQVEHSGWAWLMLYAYSFQIFLDFSGYTDIAIGIGQFLGVQLPENFNRPYLQQSLATFWNNWHMTLTNWFRAYFFNPITRAMRKAGKPSPGMILFLTQMGTMLLIGMWHGVTWNFLLWGAWHGVGLFVQNRWSDRIGPAIRERLNFTPRARLMVSGLNVLLTFHFVTLGWVWFALPEFQQALVFMRTLFGF